jgi:hypothetical protein
MKLTSIKIGQLIKQNMVIDIKLEKIIKYSNRKIFK